MRCPKCGFENNDNAKTCAKCGAFIDPRDEEKKRHRRVVQLSSGQAASQTVPLDTQKVIGAARQKANEAARRRSGEEPSDGRSPHPRRRSAATGKIPAIKHPSHEDGKIPAEERRSASSAEQTQRMPRTTKTIIDDAVIAAESASAPYDGASTRSRDQVTTRRRATNADNRSDRQRKRTKTFIIAVAILIIICLFALGMFLVNTTVGDKTVKFDTNGGTVIGNQYVLPDDELARPANPTRPGYEFDGWYLDANYSEEAAFPIKVTRDMTLYAKWKQETTKAEPVIPDLAQNEATQPTQETTQPSESAGSGASGGTGNSGSSAGRKPSVGSSSGGSSGGGSATKPSTGGGGSSGGSINSNPASNGQVSVTVTASNGSKLTGTVTLKNGYVIPDSSTKAYTIEELRALNLNPAELCIARNEIYAREGYSFRNTGLQSYFNARSWYRNKGWRGQLPEGSAAYITAHNLLALAKQTPSATPWLSLKY